MSAAEAGAGACDERRCRGRGRPGARQTRCSAWSACCRGAAARGPPWHGSRACRSSNRKPMPRAIVCAESPLRNSWLGFWVRRNNKAILACKKVLDLVAKDKVDDYRAAGAVLAQSSVNIKGEVAPHSPRARHGLVDREELVDVSTLGLGHRRPLSAELDSARQTRKPATQRRRPWQRCAGAPRRP